MLGSSKPAIEIMASDPEGAHLRLALILNQLPVGIGVYDAAGKLFHANEAFHRLGGEARSDLQLLARAQIHVDDVTASMPDQHPGLRALRGEVATPPAEYYQIDADNIRAWRSISAVPLADPVSQKPVGAVLVLEDDEERHAAAAEARNSKMRFRQFAEHSVNALWVANVDSGMFEYINPAGLRMWGKPDESATISSWLDGIHPDDRIHVAFHRKRVLHGSCERFQYRIEGPAGFRQVRETSFLIPAERHNDACVGGIVEDMSPDYSIYLVQSGDNTGDVETSLRISGHRLKTFPNVQAFLAVADFLAPGCVMVDLRSGTEPPDAAVQLLKARPAELPVIFLGSEDTDTPDIIAAMRAGAADYLLPPFADDALVEAVERAHLHLSPSGQPLGFVGTATEERLANLPRREFEVLLGLMGGGTNKVIARDLGISPRTVEVHRAHLMERLNVRTLAELLRMAHAAGLQMRA